MVLQNAGDSATLSASPALVATLPVENLQKQEGAAVARSTSTANQYIYFDMDRVRSIENDMFVLMGDFSDEAIVNFRLYEGAGQTGNENYTLESEKIWKPIPWEEFGPWGEYEWGGGKIYDATGSIPTFFNAPKDNVDIGNTYLSGEIEIIDPNNPLGYHNLHRLFIGTLIQPINNMEFNYTIGLVDDSEQEPDDGAGLITFSVETYKKLSFNLPILSRQEMVSLWAGLQYCGLTHDIYIDALGFSSGAERIIHIMRAKLIKIPEFTPPFNTAYKTNFEFREVK
jgi:hypothetical protein